MTPEVARSNRADPIIFNEVTKIVCEKCKEDFGRSMIYLKSAVENTKMPKETKVKILKLLE